jgi:hypothetical protein
MGEIKALSGGRAFERLTFRLSPSLSFSFPHCG